jgi:hypothetical protein
MNSLEKQMSQILEELKGEFGALAAKAEFEAEGTRIDELLRLIDIARSANLKITVKIGGCEAIRDLLEAKQIGVDYIVAPMVESGYAASKFVAAKNLVYDTNEQTDVDFLCNLETALGASNIEEILEAISENGGLNGLVFGRVDFIGSLKMRRNEVDSIEVLKHVLSVSKALRERKLDLVVGGGVSSDSIDFLREVATVHLTRYETRKIVFDGDSIRKRDIGKGLLKAVHFELLWLLNKRDYYGRIQMEDEKRIQMLESRWNILKQGSD